MDDDTDALDGPLENGYGACEISEGNVCFVRGQVTTHGNGSIVTSYDFPYINTAPNPYLISHHPQDVCGYEDEKLIKGIL